MNKSRKSSAQGALETFAELAIEVVPTSELNTRELDHFERVVQSRERTTWSRNDAFLATQLAVMYRRLEDLSVELDSTGYTLENNRGTQTTNPLFTAMMQSTQAIQSLTKTLGLSAPQRGLNSREQRNRNSADAQALEVINRVGSDDLLA